MPQRLAADPRDGVRRVRTLRSIAEQRTRRRVQGCATVDGRHQAMKKAKVLVVDDAMLIRRMVTDVLAADPQIEVVGEAINGRVAMQKIAQLNPDLITLDIEMPEMDGISTLKEIRKTYPRLPVIMFSALTERGAADTLEALHHGASDYVTKPASPPAKRARSSGSRKTWFPRSSRSAGWAPRSQAPREETPPRPPHTVRPCCGRWVRRSPPTSSRLPSRRVGRPRLRKCS